MPIEIPIPAGLELPAEGQIEISITAEIRDGELYVLTIGGVPLEEGGDEPEMDEEATPAAPAEDADFLSAVEAGMKNQ